MTSELIERVALNLRLAGICHAHTHSVQIARAVIRVIAPAVLDEATNLADGHLPLGYMSERERSYCNEHGKEIAHAIRALKTRYEQ